MEEKKYFGTAFQEMMLDIASGDTHIQAIFISSLGALASGSQEADVTAQFAERSENYLRRYAIRTRKEIDKLFSIFFVKMVGEQTDE